MTMRLLGDFDLLICPGTGNSDPEHWQSHWCRMIPTASRVLQHDWQTPKLNDWIDGLDAAVRAGRRPALLVGHSRSCGLIAHWAAARPAGRVAGALLVAPTDMDGPYGQSNPSDFSPMSRSRLPFPAIAVASTNDEPYLSVGRAQEMAEAWGAELAVVGPFGHINAASQLGAWPDGLALLGRLIGRIG